MVNSQNLTHSFISKSNVVHKELIDCSLEKNKTNKDLVKEMTLHPTRPISANPPKRTPETSVTKIATCEQ